MRLTRQDHSPHVFTPKTRQQPAEFLITCAKRLLQQYRPHSDALRQRSSSVIALVFAAEAAGETPGGRPGAPTGGSGCRARRRQQRARLAGVVLITRDTTGWSRPSPKERTAREEITSPRAYPGSLPLEPALRNCRRTLLQASERRDPGMTGALGDWRGRSQTALAA